MISTEILSRCIAPHCPALPRTHLSAISGKELYVSPASSPATKAPDTAVKKMSVLVVMASLRNDSSLARVAGLVMAAVTDAGDAFWSRISMPFQNRPEYRTWRGRKEVALQRTGGKMTLSSVVNVP